MFNDVVSSIEANAAELGTDIGYGVGSKERNPVLGLSGVESDY